MLIRSMTKPISLVFSLLLFGIIIFGSFTHTTSAQEPVPTPDQRLDDLRATITVQQNQLDQLNQNLDLTERELRVIHDEIVLEINNKVLWVWVVIGGGGLLLSIFGFKNYNDLTKLYHDRMRETLQKNLYRLDPTFLPIHIPSTGFEDEIKRIQITGLKNIHRYDYPGKGICNGVVIFPVSSPEEEKSFRTFIEEYEPDPLKAAYILYSPARKHSISPETFKSFLNLTAATNPTALARAILDVGRGLKPVN